MSVSTLSNLENTTTFHVAQTTPTSGTTGLARPVSSEPSGSSPLTALIVQLLPPLLSTDELFKLTAAKKGFDQKKVWQFHLQARYAQCLQKIQMEVEPNLYRVEIKRLCFELEKLKIIINNIVIENKDIVEILLPAAIGKGCYTVAEQVIKKNKLVNTHLTGIHMIFLQDVVIPHRVITARVLLEQGVISNGLQIEALEQAIYRGHEDIAAALLKNPALTQQRGFFTKAIDAVEHRPRMVRWLFEHQVTTTLEPSRNSLLVQAISLGHIETVRLLLEKGANIRELSPGSGRTPLMEAAYQSQIETINMLLAHPDADVDKDAEGKPVCIKPAFINQVDAQGRTALMYAAENWEKGISGMETILTLLQHKANVNCLSRDGETALMIAKENHIKRPKIEQLLVQYGARHVVHVKLLH